MCGKNGTGEAKEADIGIAGVGEGLIIKHGEIVQKSTGSRTSACIARYTNWNIGVKIMSKHFVSLSDTETLGGRTRRAVKIQLEVTK